MENIYPNEHYLLACSGGPDSMALFNMLLEEKISFSVALVNYHKRDVSNDEEKMVEEFSLRHHIRFFHIDAVKKDKKGNFQSWARKIRYEFFYKLAKEINAKGIIIAHHKDDLLETYLFQKNRHGIYDYYGLKSVSLYKDVLLIRPLLNYRKKELLNYCINNSIPYSIDESNLKDDYERNRIRHSIVEKLDNIEIEKLLYEIEELNKKNYTYFLMAKEYINKYQNHYPISDFKSMKKSIQQRVIFELLKINNKFSSGRGIEAIILFIISKNNNEVFSFKNSKLKIYKNYGYFEFCQEVNFEYEFVINENKIIDNKIIYIDLVSGKERFYIKDDSYPIKITNVKKDDIVKIGSIHKSINRLFIDEKIPLKYRNIWPCIKDCSGKIIFVPRNKEIVLENNKLVFAIKDNK